MSGALIGLASGTVYLPCLFITLVDFLLLEARSISLFDWLEFYVGIVSDRHSI